VFSCSLAVGDVSGTGNWNSSDVRICCDGFEVCYATEAEWIGSRGCSSVGCLRCLIGNEAVCIWLVGRM